jgi:hypothetical protein
MFTTNIYGMWAVSLRLKRASHAYYSYLLLLVVTTTKLNCNKHSGIAPWQTLFTEYAGQRECEFYCSDGKDSSNWWGESGERHTEQYLLECDTMQSGINVPRFRRQIFLLLSSQEALSLPEYARSRLLRNVAKLLPCCRDSHPEGQCPRRLCHSQENKILPHHLWKLLFWEIALRAWKGLRNADGSPQYNVIVFRGDLGYNLIYNGISDWSVAYCSLVTNIECKL